MPFLPRLLEVAPGDYLNLLRDAYEPPVEAERKNGRLEQSLWCLEEIKLIPFADLMDLIAATISPYSLLTQVPSLFLLGWERGIFDSTKMRRDCAVCANEGSTTFHPKKKKAEL